MTSSLSSSIRQSSTYIALSFATISLFIAGGITAYAQTQASTTTRTAPAPKQAVLLASVDIMNATVMKKSDTSLAVSFMLRTDDVEQTGMRYSLSLLNSEGKMVYTSVSKNAITAIKARPQQVTETFAIPAGLTGAYTVQIFVVNNSGLTLAVGKTPSVTLASPKVEAASLSCTADKKIIQKSDTLSIACTIAKAVTNTETKNASVSINLYRGNEKISLYTNTSALTDKGVTFTIPPQALPGMYAAVVQQYTKDNAPLGESYMIPFMIEGEYIRVVSLTLDKDSYAQGDAARVVAGLQALMKSDAKLFVTTKLVNQKGNACAADTRVPLTRMGSATVDVPITGACNGYTATLSIVDEQGTVLATKSVAITPQGNGDRDGFSILSMYAHMFKAMSLLWLALGAIVAVLVFAGLHMKNRKAGEIAQ